MTHIQYLPNLFTSEEIDYLNDLIANLDSYPYPELGRLHFEDGHLPPIFEDRLLEVVRGVYQLDPKTPLQMVNPPLYVEYNAEYGQPNLRPHVDGDFNDYIIDYQLSSSQNTSWPLGVNKGVYDLKDNDAVIFNPNTNIHWRPEKTFQQGEYIRMVFFRFFNPESPSDYSHLPHNPNDPMFAEVMAFRDGLAANS